MDPFDGLSMWAKNKRWGHVAGALQYLHRWGAEHGGSPFVSLDTVYVVVGDGSHGGITKYLVSLTRRTRAPIMTIDPSFDPGRRLIEYGRERALALRRARGRRAGIILPIVRPRGPSGVSRSRRLKIIGHRAETGTWLDQLAGMSPRDVVVVAFGAHTSCEKLAQRLKKRGPWGLYIACSPCCRPGLKHPRKIIGNIQFYTRMRR